MRQELGLENNISDSPYQKLDRTAEQIIRQQEEDFERGELKTEIGQKYLPYIYGTAKMHKPIFKLRYIAASHKCTTQPLATLATKCLKLCHSTPTP